MHNIIPAIIRLKETVDHCKQCWVSSLVSSYVYHLSNAQRELEKFRNTKEKELEGNLLGVQSTGSIYFSAISMIINFMIKCHVLSVMCYH